MKFVKGLTKKQKETAYLTQKLVGESVAVQVSKTKKNHIRYDIDIEGVPPIFTAGTPSCSRSYIKHLSTVKRLTANAANDEDELIGITTLSTLNSAKLPENEFHTVLSNACQFVMLEIDSLQLQEQAIFETSQSIEKVKVCRQTWVEQKLKDLLTELALFNQYRGNKQRKLAKLVMEYIKPRLPELGSYKHEIKTQKKVMLAKESVKPAVKIENMKANAISKKKKRTAMDNKAKSAQDKRKPSQTNSEEIKNDCIENLELSQLDFSQLDYQHLKKMLEKIEQEMATKQQKALSDILHIVSSHNITEEQILEALNFDNK